MVRLKTLLVPVTYLTILGVKFKYWHDETEMWSMKHLKEAKFLEVAYDDSLEAQSVHPGSVINYPLRSVEELLTAREFVLTEEDRNASPIVRRL